MPVHVLEGGEGDKNEVIEETEGECFSCMFLVTLCHRFPNQEQRELVGVRGITADKSKMKFLNYTLQKKGVSFIVF